MYGFDVANNGVALPVSCWSAGNKPRSGVVYSPGRAVLREPWEQGFSFLLLIVPDAIGRGRLRGPVRLRTTHTRERAGRSLPYSRDGMPSASGVRHEKLRETPVPRAREYARPGLYQTPLSRLYAGIPTRDRGGRSIVFHVKSHAHLRCYRLDVFRIQNVSAWQD